MNNFGSSVKPRKVSTHLTEEQNQRLSKILNIHSNSGLFRANVRCFSIIIDCLRDIAVQ